MTFMKFGYCVRNFSLPEVYLRYRKFWKLGQFLSSGVRGEYGSHPADPIMVTNIESAK
jgi:hypothetical protein